MNNFKEILRNTASASSTGGKYIASIVAEEGGHIFINKLYYFDDPQELLKQLMTICDIFSLSILEAVDLRHIGTQKHNMYYFRGENCAENLIKALKVSKNDGATK